MIKRIQFPPADEYPTYAGMYMNWVKKDGSFIEQLEDSLSITQMLISSFS